MINIPEWDADFWRKMNNRINGALHSSSDDSIRFLWMDGFVPHEFRYVPDQDRIIGWGFVSEGGTRSFVQYRISLHLDPSAVEACRNEEWERLLPDPDSTEWLVVRRKKRRMMVECSASAAPTT